VDSAVVRTVKPFIANLKDFTAVELLHRTEVGKGDTETERVFITRVQMIILPPGGSPLLLVLVNQGRRSKDH
jgi:hypothetical protein